MMARRAAADPSNTLASPERTHILAVLLLTGLPASRAQVREKSHDDDNGCGDAEPRQQTPGVGPGSRR
jgi:hypothetical protein